MVAADVILSQDIISEGLLKKHLFSQCHCKNDLNLPSDTMLERGMDCPHFAKIPKNVDERKETVSLNDSLSNLIVCAGITVILQIAQKAISDPKDDEIISKH